MSIKLERVLSFSHRFLNLISVLILYVIYEEENGDLLSDFIHLILVFLCR